MLRTEGTALNGDFEAIKKLALHYLSRRETTRHRLTLYLRRKFPDQDDSTIVAVLDRLEELKLVDDQRYSDILTRDLKRRGKGPRAIRMGLLQKGVAANVAQEFSVEPKNESEERANDVIQKFLRRFETESPAEIDTHKLREKCTRKLAALGFDYDVIQRVVKNQIQCLGKKQDSS